MKRDVKLNHLLDGVFEQALLNSISRIFGFAVGIDTQSNMVFNKTKNTTNHCNYIVKHKKSYKKCYEFTRNLAAKAIEQGRALYGICPCGLVDIVIPIYIMGNLIGTVVCGQIFIEDPSDELIEKNIKEFGFAPIKYKKYVNEVKVINEEKLKIAIEEISLFCQTISKILCKNYILEEVTKRESFLRAVTHIISNNNDLPIILHKMAEELAILFDTQRVTIINYSGSDISIEEDFVNSKNIQIENFSKQQYSFMFNKFKSILEQNNSFVIKFEDILEFDNIDENIVKYCVESGFSTIAGFIVSENKNTMRMVLLSSFEKKKNWYNDELAFFTVVREQVTLALKQVGLQALISTKEKMAETILNNVPFYSWIKDLSGKYIFSNDKACFFSGQMKNDDISGDVDYELLMLNNKNIFDEGDEYILSKNKSYVTERLFTIKNQKRWLEIVKTPIKDENGKITAISGYARDITEQKMLEQLKDDFISVIGHEFRTPLSAVIGGLKLILGDIEDKNVSDKINEMICIANGNAIKLSNLINNILDYERLEADKMKYYPERLDFNEFINNTLKDGKNYAKQFNVNITLQNNIKTDELKLKVDKVRLSQVVHNLLANAVEHTKKTHNVDMQVDLESDNFIRISITNYGEVIPKELTNKLFKKFSQLDSSNTREKRGAGLSLIISRIIIEDMKGKINYISKNNQTTFYIDIPIYR